MVPTPLIKAITHLPTQEGWEAELTWLADPQLIVYPQSSHLTITGQAKDRENLPANDRRPNH